MLTSRGALASRAPLRSPSERSQFRANEIDVAPGNAVVCYCVLKLPEDNFTSGMNGEELAPNSPVLSKANRGGLVSDLKFYELTGEVESDDL